MNPVDKPKIMFLLAGLGNPGREYARTRHNIGFMALDQVAAHCRAEEFRTQKKWEGLYQKGTLAGEDILFFKPLTYMNESGRAVQKVAHFYDIPVSQIIVLHDDLDLPLGKLRIRAGGQSGGHNGIKSLIAHLNPDFIRVKMGILPEEGKREVVDLVLSTFAQQEQIQVGEMLDLIPSVVETILFQGVEQAQNQFN